MTTPTVPIFRRCLYEGCDQPRVYGNMARYCQEHSDMMLLEKKTTEDVGGGVKACRKCKSWLADRVCDGRCK